MGVIFSEVITLTPEIARQLLSTTENNRRISNETVLCYAVEMKAGRWFDNGVPIIVTDRASGISLIDGQHRCAAVIKSGVSIPVEIKHVSEKDAQGYDLNRVRTVADMIKMSDEPDAAFRDNKIIGAVNYLLRHATGMKKPPKNAVVLAMRMMQNAIRYTYHAVANIRGVSKSPVLSAIITVYENGYPLELLDSFITALKTGFMSSDNDKTVIRLRESLAKSKSSGGVAQTEVYGITINALYNYQRYHVMARIPAAPDKYPLPKCIIEIKEELTIGG